VGPSETQWDLDSFYGLTDIQVRAIELTVQGHPDTQIAQVLSINRKTLWIGSKGMGIFDEHTSHLLGFNVVRGKNRGDKTRVELFCVLCAEMTVSSLLASGFGN
jgi:hypothetical protein